MALAVLRSGSGPRLVLVHGFTQTARSWAAVQQHFASEHEVIAVDAPGHGGSHHLDADLWTAARLVVEAGGEATYVGYSMGARIVLHAALAHPESVRRVVLLGATPGLRTEVERAARRTSDEDLARSLERDGLESFLERWLANPLFAHLDVGASNIEDRLRNSVEGLASCLRNTGTGRQEDLWPRLASLRMPALLMAGSLDTKFAAIAGQMAHAIGTNATRVLVAGAGHAAHLERAEEFCAVLEQWLRESDQAPSASPIPKANP